MLLNSCSKSKVYALVQYTSEGDRYYETYLCRRMGYLDPFESRCMQRIIILIITSKLNQL